MARYSKADLLALKSVKPPLASVLHSRIVNLGIFVDDGLKGIVGVEAIDEIFPLMSLEIKEPQRSMEPTNTFIARDNTARRLSWRDHKPEHNEEHFVKHDHKSFYDNTTTYARSVPSAGYQKSRQLNGDLHPFFESNNNIHPSSGSPYMTRMNPPYEEFPAQRMDEKEEEPEWYKCPASRYDYVDIYQPLPSLDEAHEAQPRAKHPKVVAGNPPKKVFADNKAHAGAFDNYKPCEVFNNYTPREAFDGYKAGEAIDGDRARKANDGYRAREAFDGYKPHAVFDGYKHHDVFDDYQAHEMDTRPPSRRHSYNQSSHERFDCRHTIARSVMPVRPVFPIGTVMHDFTRCSSIPRKNARSKFPSSSDYIYMRRSSTTTSNTNPFFEDWCHNVKKFSGCPK